MKRTKLVQNIIFVVKTTIKKLRENYKGIIMLENRNRQRDVMRIDMFAGFWTIA